MEQRVVRLKGCLAHMQRQFGHLTAMTMPQDVRGSLGELWQHIIHMQLEVAAIERQLQVDKETVTPQEGPSPESPPRQGASALRSSPPRGAPLRTHPGKGTGTVLVIDDCENTQNILSFSLGAEGVNIASLTEPTRWVSTVRQIKPQVILLDLMMPGIDGFEVLRQLRATKDFDSIFVVVGSSRSFEHDRLTVLGMGADDFIPKPYHIKELALKFSNLIRSVRRYS